MIGRTRWHFESVESTQITAFALAELGAPHGSVVIASFQRAGRGREGRAWDAPAGSSLMFSVLLRPEGDAPLPGTISILIADALAQVFRAYCDAPVHIKWPNDVLIDGQKTSGVLVQSRLGVDPVAVVGIGINIDIPFVQLPDGATCLNRHASAPIDPEELLESIIPELQELWSSLQPNLSCEQVARLEEQLWLKGEQVSLLDGSRETIGEILGISETGGLRLLASGQERVIHAGEITRGPRRDSPSELS